MRPLLVLAALAAAWCLAGCSSAGRAATRSPTTPSTTAPSPTTAVPTTPAPTSTAPPTTVYAPTRPAPSPDSAAYALVQAWSRADRAGAAAVASPPAVAALLAIPYPGGWLQSRGCTDPSANPGTCTYANLQSGSLYEIQVLHAPAGWYVNAVTVES